MIGVAAGLALGGMRPFAYSIAPFATLRCLEQIRNDVCYHNLPVSIVGVGGGYSYGPNGPTHHAHRQVVIAHVVARSEEHTSELQSLAYLVCRLLLEKT